MPPRGRVMSTSAVCAFVHQKPGRTCEEIAREFGSTPARVGVELAELIEQGRVVAAGVKRGRRYYRDEVDVERMHRGAGK